MTPLKMSMFVFQPVTKSYSSIGRTTKVFVGGLPANADDETIRASFARFGTVSWCVCFSQVL